MQSVQENKIARNQSFWYLEVSKNFSTALLPTFLFMMDNMFNFIITAAMVATQQFCKAHLQMVDLKSGKMCLKWCQLGGVEGTK